MEEDEKSRTHSLLYLSYLLTEFHAFVKGSHVLGFPIIRIDEEWALIEGRNPNWTFVEVTRNFVTEQRNFVQETSCVFGI
jgi:hypothetical protein